MTRIPEFLEWEDLRAFEADLCQKLARFFHFSDHLLFFSRTGPDAPEYLEPERRLLLPVYSQGESRATLRLDNVEIEEAAHVLPLLTAIAETTLENVLLTRAARRDLQTGLLTEQALLDTLAERIDAAQTRENPDLRDLCQGLMVVSWPEAFETGWWDHAGEMEALWKRLARAVKMALPAGAKGARLGRLRGRYEFGALVQTAGRGACNRLALSLLEAVTDVLSSSGPAEHAGSQGPGVGHALYPQDMQPRELLAPGFAQVLKLRNRAMIAADIALTADFLREPVMAYGWIPAIGSRIAGHTANGGMRVTPGENAGLRKGQRFHVLSPSAPWTAAASKCQIIIRHTEPEEAHAEIFHIRNTGGTPEPGDRLMLVTSGEEAGRLSGALPGYEEFLARFSRESRACSRFSLVITRFWDETDPDYDTVEEGREQFQAKLVSLAERWLCGELQGGFAGCYGNDGIIAFFPGGAAPEDFYQRLHAEAGTHGLGAASGIFLYPFLNLGRSNSEAAALKALEYAQLLPEPHIGALNAKALAIDADKLFSQGEALAALAEYREAILLDPEDAGILNSLGVCLASLSRFEEARQVFQAALDKAPPSDLRAKISYNLGNLFQRENDLAQARTHYRISIKAAPGHLYAWTRLGQLYAKAGRYASSRALYRHASRLARFSPDALNMIQRQLARLETESNQTEKARELLHDSLLRDPGDHASLLLLAATYLKEDPVMAESLARRCLAMGANAWSVLSEALDAQGRREEAQKAAQRGM